MPNPSKATPGTTGWNYRVFKKACPETGEVYYEIHETYYDARHKASAWTVDPLAPCGASLADLRWDLRAMLKALERPVLVDKGGYCAETDR